MRSPVASSAINPHTEAISIVDKDGTWLDLAISGAISAMHVCVAYWLVECFLWTLWPWLTTPSYEYRQTDPWFALLALGVYIAGGATLGGVLAVSLWHVAAGSARRATPLVGPLSLAVVTGMLALVNAEYVQLFIALQLITVIVTSFRRTAWVQAIRLAVNFWSTPLGLVSYPFALSQFDNRTLGYFVGTLAVITVFLVPYFVARFFRKTRQQGETSASMDVRSIAVWVTLVAIFIALSFMLKQQPLLTGPPRMSAAPSGKDLPNVILISLDTVRADHLPLYGYARDTAPNLRRFGENASAFSNAIAASDMTLASHASMFTGLYPSQHGAHWVLGAGKEGVAIGAEFGLRLPENSQTMAGILSARGYRTIGIVANTTYLQHAFRLDQGFGYYSQPNPVLFLERREPFLFRTNLCRLVGHFFPHSMSDLEYTRAADINREAFQLLEQEKAHKKPFFLFLNYMDAHQPYFPPAPYDSRYPGEDPTLTAFQYWEIERAVLRQVRPYTARDRQRDESQYDGGIAYMDANLGALFAKLKELGLYDDSLIMVTSDHGQSFGEKQLVGHGTSVYQEQVRVPLIVKYPGPPQRAARNDLVSHVDLLPTVLDLLGEKIPPFLPGRSLRAAAASRVSVISESFPCDLTVSFNSRFRRVERAAYSGPFKLILATNGKREFYDLSADTHEEHNLYSQNLPAATRMESDLRRWIAALPKEHARPAVLDKSGVDRLKSLGYVQ